MMDFWYENTIGAINVCEKENYLNLLDCGK